MDSQRRPDGAHALGAWGEELALSTLQSRGWTLVERNYRFGRREIDLVVRRGATLAFVEVKTRSGAAFGPPEEAVTALKRREIEAVARHFLASRKPGDVEVRFDVVAIVTGPDGAVSRLAHLEDAWRPETR